jgi:hypothetical protein
MMPGRVFISCGQATEEERRVASAIRACFEDAGFRPYVAIQAQSIQDVNSAIISELKAADYYVFVDFPRDPLPHADGPQHRGSLFTHQELAIAYTLGFEKAIFLQSKDVKLEGLLRYIASNSAKFSQADDALVALKQLVEERRWDPAYSRHMVVQGIHWSDAILSFASHTGEALVGRFLYLDIENRRADVAAFNCIARLASLEGPPGTAINHSDRSHLKVTGHPGFVQTIWPAGTGAFDLLVVKQQGGAVCLNNALDVIPKPQLVSKPGPYLLHYEVLAEAFPVLKLAIRLDVTGNPMTTLANVV